MKYLKIMGLALVAALALSVVASASAAEPELVKKGGGAVVKKKFKGEGKGTTFVLETVAGHKITCTSLSAEGEIVSATEATQTVTFKGCTAEGITAYTSGSPEGDILVKVSVRPRWWTIGRTVFLLISILPIGSTILIDIGKPIIFASILVRGTFLVPFRRGLKEPFLTETGEAKQTKGIQEFTEFEVEKEGKTEKVKNTLESKGEKGVKFEFEQSGEEASEEVKFEEEVELV